MLRLRPYKPSDADTILKWIKDEDAFRKWSTDRYPHYPITADDMNYKYMDCNGDCAEPDNFYPMTAFDDSGIVGPFEGSKPRQLLIDRAKWQEMQMASAEPEPTFDRAGSISDVFESHDALE